MTNPIPASASAARHDLRRIADEPAPMYVRRSVKPPIRVVAVMEGTYVTGPAKNLIEFAKIASGEVELSVVAYMRGGSSRAFVDACQACGIGVDIIRERRAFD